jgi:hypothetical protein
MNTIKLDENGDEIILSESNQQVMMEWEKPYMEKSIDALSPSGDVLEIGFGCGYSATQIMKYPIKSYTIIECDSDTIKRIEEWKKDYSVPIIIIHGTWQSKLHSLGVFDKIYFDDFPLNLNENSSSMEILVSRNRSKLFMDLIIRKHTKVCSQISYYLNGIEEPMFSSDSEPFISKECFTIDVVIPKNCKYRDTSVQKCTIPIVTKVKEFDINKINCLSPC